MSEDGPPKLRKPGTRDGEKKGSGKFKNAETNIREKLGSLKFKKPETDIKNKVNSLKSKSNEPKKEGPRKLGKPVAEPSAKSRSDRLKKDTAQLVRGKPLLSIIGLIIIIIMVVTVAIWAVGDKTATTQTNNTTNSPPIIKDHYSDGNVSFNYPEGWNVTNVSNSSNSQYSFIVTVAKDQNNSFTVFKEALGTQNFTYRVSQWRSNILQNGMIYYEGDLNIDNNTAYEFEANYKPGDKIFATRGIAFQKNGTVYYLIFVFDESLLDYKNEMDKVINSFHVT